MYVLVEHLYKSLIDHRRVYLRLLNDRSSQIYLYIILLLSVRAPRMQNARRGIISPGRVQREVNRSKSGFVILLIAAMLYAMRMLFFFFFFRSFCFRLLCNPRARAFTRALNER